MLSTYLTKISKIKFQNRISFSLSAWRVETGIRESQENTKMADTQNTNSQSNNTSVPLADQVKEQSQQAIQQGQQYAGQAVDLVSSRLKATLGEQKDHLAAGITGAAQMLKQNSESFRTQGVGVLVGPYLDQAVDKLNEVGTTIQNKSVDEVIQDTENFGRSQPAYFLAAAAVIGFAAARFLKSSGAQAATS
jgi:ElaB/YqjD/DUF883 family membrane-anchored ribosome-binding protein